MKLYLYTMTMTAILFVTGCSMIPAEMRAPLDQAIKEHGAGNYYMACQLGKDQQQLLSIRGDMECTADMLQMTGCHKRGVTVGGPQ